MGDVDPWTVMRLLRAAVEHVRRRDPDSPRLDAELLLAHVLKKRRLDLYMMFDMPVTDEARDAFRALIRRRAAGEPVSRILGAREFHGRVFSVDRRVLVPRPETEHVVDAALSWIRARTNVAPGLPPVRILDLGTGSGCLAITLALEVPGSVVTAVDLSSDALDMAATNARHLGADVRFLTGDLFGPLTAGSIFDVVVSNPPYVTDAEFADLAPEVRDHDPELALRSGRDALAFHRRILREGAVWVAPDHRFALELGAAPADLRARVVQVYPAARVQVLNDLAGLRRVLVVDGGRVFETEAAREDDSEPDAPS